MTATTEARAAARLRWTVLALLIAASFLNYFDRQTLSVLKTTLKGAFSFDDAEYAQLVNAFTITYAVAYIVSGWVVDRWGGRIAMTVFVAGWSLVTVGCGLATEFWMLLVFRALLGVFEPGLHPVIIRAGTALVPEGGRGMFMTVASLGGSIATVAAVPAISALALHGSWRTAFIVPGALGVALAAVWWLVYRDPAGWRGLDPGSAAGDVRSKPTLSWPQLWRTRALWGVLGARFVSDPVWYFCLFWMPGYLQEAKGLSLGTLGSVGWIPFFSSMLLTLAFMAWSDRRAHRTGVRGRKQLVIATAALGPLCLLIPNVSATWAVVLLFCLVMFTCKAWLSSLAPIIAGSFPGGNVATIYGIAGACGAFGAMLFNAFIGHASTALPPWVLFAVMALLHPCAALVLHLCVRPRER